VNSQDFEFVSQLLRKRAGIVLSGDKMYLLESRLAPLARKEGLPSIDDLIHVIRARREERLIGQLVDVMTTNETFFFRDKTPFDHLKNAILPVLGQARKGNRIRIWCAACSTGQEPYSIAMMLDQDPSLTGGVPVEIVATDISERCLERARQGLFTQFEVQRGLPIQMLMHYFTQQDDHWRISERMRQMVTFRKLNLIDPTYNLGKFDVVVCRNVLIYFDGPTKVDVLNRIAGVVNPGSFLMMGAAESLVGSSQAFEPMQDRRGLYKLVNQAGAKAASAA
jgi:chemotaxis protein methyltransferase CheR